MKPRFSYIPILFALSCLASCSIRKYQEEGQLLYIGVKGVEITGDARSAYAQRAISAAEENLGYTPNNAILGSSIYRWPLPLVGPWLHLRYKDSNTMLGKWLYRLGSNPTWLSDVNPELRAKVAQGFLRSNGYLSGTAESRLHYYGSDSSKVKVSYHLNLGNPYRYADIDYVPRVELEDSLYFDHATASKLKVGNIFSSGDLDEDRRMISQHLREHGYYLFRPEYVRYEADTLQRPGEVLLRCGLSAVADRQVLRQARLRQVRLRLLDGDTTENLLSSDTMRLKDGVTVHYSGRSFSLRRSVVERSLHLRPDSIFRQSKQESTLKNFNSLGAFSTIEPIYQIGEPDSLQRLIGEYPLDLTLLMRRDKPWDVTLEALFRIKSTDFIGPGLRYTLARRNIFGGGETFSASAYGSYEWQTGSSAGSALRNLNSYQLGLEASLTFPQLLFFGGSNRGWSDAVNSTIKLSSQILNRAKYYSMSSLGFSLSFDYSPRLGRLHSLTPLSLSYNQLRRPSEEFTRLLEQNPSLALSFQSQLIPQIQYSYTWEQSVGKNQSHYLWHQISVSEAGNLINSVSTLFGRNYWDTKMIANVPYAQFVKLASELRYSYTINRFKKLVSRLSIGAIYSFGNMTRAPYMEQFYVGGANSIRAFTVRSLGPGAFNPTESTNYTFIDRVGEFKIDANLEYRSRLLGSLYGAIFLDAGNIWLLRPDENRPKASLSEVGGLGRFFEQIAVGTGAGLRYDLDFLVLRLDVGVGLHLPYQTPKNGWYNIPSFRDALGIHLAIGYPF